MGEIVDLVAKIKKYYKPTPLEIRNFFIVVFVMAFIVSMNEWGPGENFELLTGIFNFLISAIIITVSFFFYHSVQRIIGLNLGYKVEYQLWGFGIYFALIIAFLSTAIGKTIWVLIPGGILIHHMSKHRIAFFRYGLNYFGLGSIAFTGPLATIILVIILKSLSAIIPAFILTKAIHFNLAFAVWQVLPIPPLDGSKLFFGSRMVYILGLTTVIAAAILLYVNIPLWIAVLGSILIGVICWLLYYIFLERALWKGA